MNKIENIQEIGQMIRQQRRLQKMTQQELAGICGVGVRFIRELENGKESCHMNKVLHVLHFLGLELTIYKRGEL